MTALRLRSAVAAAGLLSDPARVSRVADGIPVRADGTIAPDALQRVLASESMALADAGLVNALVATLEPTCGLSDDSSMRCSPWTVSVDDLTSALRRVVDGAKRG